MSYHTNVIKLLFSTDDHLFRIGKAEKIHKLWKATGLLVLLSILIYCWMAYLGIGSNYISTNATEMNGLTYEQSKFWFLVGRALFSVLFAMLVLFIPSLLFYLLTDIPFKKLMIMQQVVLFVLLIERLLWIPLATVNGLDWYVSPLSLGIIASYITDKSWIIFFFGAITLFQFWIIRFQVKYLTTLSQAIRKVWIWVNVIFLHLIYWVITALLAFIDTYILSGWFG
ncbi:hypothetical protein [Virgibacillus halodenitrificans]|uniref:hypothetical protein n=1 Tax=Virgibacillus halodenitrificans TaxID=1482 RepID=UPI000761FC34